ncbi:hypothetical protein [Spiroplasma endosymbiont of Nebria brevicollis]|uniref:hypothetical protein n=1 Tax=Spiroplasma endosymbiont of Nebria brevicollis TaxID=3066284 RepID=UPI00313C38B5
MIIPDLIGPKSFSPFSHVYPGGSSTDGSVGDSVFSALVVACTMALSFILSILLIYKLFIKEIDRSYIGSWLVMPMSKVNVYTTKLFVVIAYIFIFHIICLTFQEILFGSLMQDFTSKTFLYLFTINIKMCLVALLFAAFALFLVSIIDKQAISLTIVSVLLSLFTIFYIMYVVTPIKENPFYILKYFTLLILVQNPMSFDETNPIKIFISPTEWNEYYSLIINWVNLSWQMLTPVLLAIPLFTFSMVFFKNKNLSI